MDSSQSLPGTLIPHLWTCHKCGSNTFLRRHTSPSIATCLHCHHEICRGCTTTYGARLLHCVDMDQLPLFSPSRKYQHHRHSPLRRYTHPRPRVTRHSPYLPPKLVTDVIVTLYPSPDGRPSLGSFLYTRPCFRRRRRRRRRRPHPTHSSVMTNSIAAARTYTIPNLIQPPDPDSHPTVEAGIRVNTAIIAQFFASGMPSLARKLGLVHPVVCVHVDPILAFYAYCLCSSICASFMVWREGERERLAEKEKLCMMVD